MDCREFLQSAILKRPVEPRNDALAQRREYRRVADQLPAAGDVERFLLQVCPQMSEADFQFSERKSWPQGGLPAYGWSLREDDSPILRHLSVICGSGFRANYSGFYKLAQRLKPTLNEYVPDAAALQALSKSEDPTKFIRVLQGELENKLDRVNRNT